MIVGRALLVVVMTWVPLGVGCDTGCVGRGTGEAPAPVLGKVPASFSLVDQGGKPFSRSRFLGHPTVVNFIFTRCQAICPTLVSDTKLLLRELPDRVRIVTFTVDPANDTPQVLSDYAERVGADSQRWTFVTGDLGDLRRVVVRGFKVAMGEPPEEADGEGSLDILHSRHFIWVDGKARIRGYFGSHSEGRAKLLSHLVD